MTYYLIKKLHHWKDFRGQIGVFNASVGNPDGNKNYTSFLPVFDDYSAALEYVDGEENYKIYEAAQKVIDSRSTR